MALAVSASAQSSLLPPAFTPLLFAGDLLCGAERSGPGRLLKEAVEGFPDTASGEVAARLDEVEQPALVLVEFVDDEIVDEGAEFVRDVLRDLLPDHDFEPLRDSAETEDEAQLPVPLQGDDPSPGFGNLALGTRHAGTPCVRLSVASPH